MRSGMRVCRPEQAAIAGQDGPRQLRYGTSVMLERGAYFTDLCRSHLRGLVRPAMAQEARQLSHFSIVHALGKAGHRQHRRGTFGGRRHGTREDYLDQRRRVLGIDHRSTVKPREYLLGALAGDKVTRATVVQVQPLTQIQVLGRRQFGDGGLAALRAC